MKSGQPCGNADTFMPIFSAGTFEFVVAIQAKLEMEIQFAKSEPSSSK